MATRPTHCACGRPLPPPKKTGRPRRWCSDLCRKRAGRALPLPVVSSPPPPVKLSELLGPGSSDPIEGVLKCITLARSTAAAFSAVSGRTSPQLSLRCERAADGIARILRQQFKVDP